MGVLHLGYAADEDLPALYGGARALVFPSHYEGFGLPPLEMMACGGAVLGSTAGAVVETVGARAHLVDPFDQDGWTDAMQRVIIDDDWWQELRRGTREVAEPFTWERCAEATWDAYCQVLGEAATARSSCTGRCPQTCRERGAPMTKSLFLQRALRKAGEHLRSDRLGWSLIGYSFKWLFSRTKRKITTTLAGAAPEKFCQAPADTIMTAVKVTGGVGDYVVFARVLRDLSCAGRRRALPRFLLIAR